MTMKSIWHACALSGLLLAATLGAPLAAAADVDDVRAVVNQYLATEGDLEKQARLMTDNRSFIAGGFRQTDNVANMRNQIAAQERNRELDPNTKLSVRGEDIMIRMLGSDAVTLVLAKIGNDWKIVHTHQSPVGGN